MRQRNDSTQPREKSRSAGANQRPPQSQRALTALAAALAFLTFGGCGGGPIPSTNYYTLHLPPPPTASQLAEPLPYTAILQPLRASPMLTQDRIVYRPTQEEVGFYEYHRWAEDPRTTITNSVLSQLLQRGTFSQVALFDGRTRGDYILRGSIDQLEEVDFGEAVSVRVRISLEMTEAASNKPIWRKTSESTGPVAAGEVRSVVSQMSAAATKAVEDLVAGLDSFLRSNAPQRAGASAPLLPGAQK